MTRKNSAAPAPARVMSPEETAALRLMLAQSMFDMQRKGAANQLQDMAARLRWFADECTGAAAQLDPFHKDAAAPSRAMELLDRVTVDVNESAACIGGRLSAHRLIGIARSAREAFAQLDADAPKS